MRAFFLGIVLALLPRACASPPRALPVPGEGAFWVADRDGNALVRMGPALEVLARIEVAAPVRVEPLPDGGVWLASAPAGPRGTHRLLRLSADGELRAAFPVEGWVDLAPGLGDELFVLCDAPGGARLERRMGAQPIDQTDLPASATGLAPGSRTVAVRFESGQILFLPRSGTGGARAGGDWRWVPGPVLGLTAATDGGWWILDGEGCLRRLDARLRTRSIGGTGLRSPRLVRGGGPGVWVFDRERGSVARIDPSGAGWRSVGLPLAGIEAARRVGAGLLVGGGGAVLRLGPSGEVRWGQGGLAFVADL